MSYLLCLFQQCLPKFSLFENDEDEAGPALFENIKDDIAFKKKVFKKQMDLKAEMRNRETVRQDQKARIQRMGGNTKH